MENQLALTKTLIYESLQLRLTDFENELESREYSACRFRLNELRVVGRTAKITPTKSGQFVTLWKRTANGPIAPLDDYDAFDLVLINVKKGDHTGQFVFPKAVLCKRGIVSQKLKEGKRAFRVYPPWDETTSKQAQKTQVWQSEFFVSLNSDISIDYEKVRKLYLQN